MFGPLLSSLSFAIGLQTILISYDGIYISQWSFDNSRFLVILLLLVSVPRNGNCTFLVVSVNLSTIVNCIDFFKFRSILFAFL